MYTAGSPSIFDLMPISGTALTIALILSLIGCIAVYILFLRRSTRGRYSGILASLARFFCYARFWIPTVIKLVSAFVTILCVIGGIIMLFTNFLSGLLTLLLGPIVVRLICEGTLLLYAMQDDLAELRRRRR